MRSRPIVLVIAGSDSSGGAGLVRDVQVLTDFEVDARCVVTAVTAQSNTRVAAIHCVPPEMVVRQLRAALDSGPVGAIKIGMLATRATIEAVAEALPSRERVPIVLDPVLVATSGGALLEEPALSVLRDVLLPRITLVTPNLSEAAALLREPVQITEAQMIGVAQRMLSVGSQAVLLKGGHAQSDMAVDVLVEAGVAPHVIRASRVRATLRGTGCALSSAIAASLTRQPSLIQACERAKRYVRDALEKAVVRDVY